jgi:mannose-6-phosphate isomerase-like protein (cupin superfamily)
VSTKWTPDDSIIEGETGKKRIREALERLGFKTDEDRVITSRDPGMDEVRFHLRREKMPPGYEQWQLPVKLSGETFFFLTLAQPGAVVPTHRHERDLFRIVVWGSVIYNGIELKQGDWMFVPKGVPYSLSAAISPNSPGGAMTCHAYA